MKVAVDLHIHSALSPCADNDMTPNNIVNMAWLKGLDIIAVTDHNSAENLHAVLKCAKKMGIVVVPGMEVETSEEIHLVCLFPGIKEALRMQEIVYQSLPDMQNREDIFGDQLVFDEKDYITGHIGRFLITASKLGIDEVFENVSKLGGVVIPAHIDRESYSIISNLGMIPENLDIKYVELSRDCNPGLYFGENPNLKAYKFIKSSDAHNLESISERENFIDLEEVSIDCLLNKLKQTE